MPINKHFAAILQRTTVQILQFQGFAMNFLAKSVRVVMLHEVQKTL